MSGLDGGVDSSSHPDPPAVPVQLWKRLCEIQQHYLDRVTPFITGRWIFTLCLIFLYLLRVYLLSGWFIITYALGLYLLNLFIAFLTPKVDPATLGDQDEDGPSLPTKANEEFRPFIRRLPEFKFWYSASKAVLIAMTCTCFQMFNVPVFWPILVMYFLLLLFFTMKQQILHMIKYRYLPFSHGKARYKGKEDSGKVVSS